MNVIIRNLKISGTIIIASFGIQAAADDFKDIVGYDEVSIADESVDQTIVDDISDAIGNDADLPERAEESQSDVNPSDYRFSNATPEPQYDPGMSDLANKFSAKKKVVKNKTKNKMKRGKKLAKNFKKKIRAGKKAKKRTLAKNLD